MIFALVRRTIQRGLDPPRILNPEENGNAVIGNQNHDTIAWLMVNVNTTTYVLKRKRDDDARARLVRANLTSCVTVGVMGYNARASWPHCFFADLLRLTQVTMRDPMRRKRAK